MPQKRINLEAERGRLMLSKSEICRELGITTKTWNSYINGQNIPSKVLVKLREMTGKSVDYLLGMIDDE